MKNFYDLIVLGSGPAGYTTAVYASRGGFKVLLLAGNQVGGQLILTTHIENYPGFSDGITGMELMGQMKKQAEKFGTEVVIDVAVSISNSISDLNSGSNSEDKKQVSIINVDRRSYLTANFLIRTQSGKEFLGRAVVVATGASALWLSAPGLGQFKGRGISACATCDGPFFKDKTVCVIGGGDTAFIEAEFLTRFAKKVFIIHRRENFRAEKIMQDRVLANEKVIPLYNSQVVEFLGDQKLTAVELESKLKVESDKRVKEVSEYFLKYGLVDKNKGRSAPIINNGEEKIIWKLPIDGAFMAIGHKPNTDFLRARLERSRRDFLELDEHGYIKTHDEVFTSVEGVFAAGDVVCNVYKQATIAVGSGCKAAIEAQNFLKRNF